MMIIMVQEEKWSLVLSGIICIPWLVELGSGTGTVLDTGRVLDT